MASRVALVFPYFRTRAPTEMLFSPLGIAGLAAGLKERGIQIHCFDCTFSTFDKIGRDVEGWAPAIVGVSVMVTTRGSALSLARRFRKTLPEALLAAGGPLPTLFPERFLGTFDVVFRGESDCSFPRFCADYLLANAPDGDPVQRLRSLALESYEGLSVGGDEPVENPATHCPPEELARLPLADRSDFDHASYQRCSVERNRRKSASLMITRGCPHACDFCSRPVFGRDFRRRDLDDVFREIAYLKRLGYDDAWIADDAFTLDRDLLGRFCRRMVAEGRPVSWSCLSRAAGIEREAVAHMKEAGCAQVHIGLESGNDAILRQMNKQTTVADGEKAVRLFHEAGIETSGFFIVGYPGETIATIEDTFRLALSLPLDDISFTVPYPLPGSALYERLRDEVDGEADWDVENEVKFVYRSRFDEAWLSRRIDETLETFRRGASKRRRAVNRSSRFSASMIR